MPDKRRVYRAVDRREANSFSLGRFGRRCGLSSAHELQSRTQIFTRVLIFQFPQARLVWPRKLHTELDVRTEFRAPVAFVVLNFKCESLTLHMRHQQSYGTFVRCMPRLILVTSFLIVKNNSPADLSACFINLEVDTREVVHFPFPGSAEGRFLRNSCCTLRDKGRRLDGKHGNSSQYRDQRYPANFHFANLPDVTSSNTTPPSLPAVKSW